MSEKNFVELLGRGGEMRKYFVDALNGAEWVDTIYDEVVAQLAAGYTYFPLVEEKEMGQWMNWLHAHPRFFGITSFRSETGWQVNIAVDDPTNFISVDRPDLVDAHYTAFQKFAAHVQPAG